MEKKQTSVEWFFEQLLLHPLPKSKDELLKGDWSDIFERAKQMEIENIIKARHDGIKYTLMSLNKSQGYLSDENYIKETFKLEK